ncbi:MAG: FAD-binding protein [Paracoccaceae bacterium]
MTAEAQLAAQIKTATGPLHIIGGGSRSIGPATGRPIFTETLTGITHYDPGALTIIARAGTPLAEVEAALAENNQILPFEPVLPGAALGRTGASTIGGVVAANASGARRISAGACRDAALGLTFIDGLGQIHRAGGRVMKNVTGYDTTRLLCGSHGTLGLITKVALKLLPAPETTLTLRAEGLDDVPAIAALTQALATPYDVSAAQHVCGGATLLRLEGFAASTKARTAALQALLPQFSLAKHDWAAARQLHGMAPEPNETLWRISTRPSHGAATGAALRTAAASRIAYDWAGGLIWAIAPKGADLRAAMPHTGHATRLDDAAAAFHPEPGPQAALSVALRQKFDPKALFNHAKMA